MPLGPPHHEQPAGRVSRTRFRSRSATRPPDGSPRSARARPASRSAIPSSSTAGGAAGPAGNAPTGATTPARAPSAAPTAAGSGATAAWPSISSFRRRGTSCRRRGSIRCRAAPLTDAALTSYHAAKLSLPQLRPGTTALVLGVGGLGHMAVQVLKAISPARIVAVDVRDAALELARAAGADAVLSADGLTPDGRPRRDRSRRRDRRARLRRQRRDAGAGRRLGRPGWRCHVRRPRRWRAPGGARADSVRVHGAHADVGHAGRAGRGGGARRAGAIHSEAEVYGLDDAVGAYGKLRHGDVLGRAVVVSTPDPTLSVLN